MRVVLSAVIVAFIAAACGSGGEQTGAGPSSTGQAELPPPSVAEIEPDAELRPPPILLVSTAGVQPGAQGSSCVHGGDLGICTDMEEPDPEQLTVVRPGEAVEIVVTNAESAAGQLTVRRLGCEETVASSKLAGPTTRWVVDLEPGAYDLDVFVGSFETESTYGDASASLGLLVDETAPAGLIPAGAGSGC